MMFPEHETRKRGQKNAFGKCVSQTAKAKAEKREDTAETNAANADCKEQQAADAAKSRRTTRTSASCVKAATGNRDDD